MIRLPNGDLSVEKSEPITVTVVASNTDLSVAFSDFSWTSISNPDPHTEIRTFDSPNTSGATCGFTIVFNFKSQPDGSFPAGAQYTVEVKGKPNEDVSRKTNTPPPPVQDRQYNFVVR